MRNQEIDRVRNFVQTLLNINGQFYIVGWRSVKWDFFFSWCVHVWRVFRDLHSEREERESRPARGEGKPGTSAAPRCAERAGGLTFAAWKGNTAWASVWLRKVKK